MKLLRRYHATIKCSISRFGNLFITFFCPQLSDFQTSNAYRPVWFAKAHEGDGYTNGQANDEQDGNKYRDEHGCINEAKNKQLFDVYSLYHDDWYY